MKHVNKKIQKIDMFLSFSGLTVSEAAKLCSYMHFREPKLLLEKTLLQKANLDKSIDFMDTLEEDIPKGNFFILEYLIAIQI